MSSSQVEQIKERLPIADVIQNYIKIDKAGSQYKARCPFHNERTPSFFVSPSRSTYYCFGCGAKGDIFSFVERFEGLDFVGALKVLAERAGVELKHESVKMRDEKAKLYEVVDEAVRFYEHELENYSDAYRYLIDRGLREKTIKDWRIGFAPDSWRTLLNYMTKRGYDKGLLEKAGLIKQKDQSTGQSIEDYYDRFRSRIMFPLFDSANRAVAFSGRIFGKDEDAKYLNSPETALFHKSRFFYGLDKAKTTIVQQKFAILVEGQVDLLMMHQAGITNTLASSGTALTEDHLLILKRFTDRIMFVYDGDEAGFNASLRGARIALELGFEVKVARLQGGLDPADAIKKDSKIMVSALKDSKNFIEFHLDQILSSTNDRRLQAKKIVAEILPDIARLPKSVEQDYFLQQVAHRGAISEKSLRQDFEKIGKVAVVRESPRGKEVVKQERQDIIERRLMGIMFWQETLKSPIIDSTKLIDDLSNISTALKERWIPFKDEIIYEAEILYGQVANLDKEVSELVKNYKDDSLRKELVEVMEELARAEKNMDNSRINVLLKRCQELMKGLGGQSS